VGCTVLEYLVKLRAEERDGREEERTAFHLCHKVPGLKTQNQERLEEVLQLLVIKKLVSVRTTGSSTVYRATDDGVRWYTQTAMDFYKVFMPVYRKPDLV
jgi:hypothetical protein